MLGGQIVVPCRQGEGRLTWSTRTAQQPRTDTHGLGLGGADQVKTDPRRAAGPGAGLTAGLGLTGRGRGPGPGSRAVRWMSGPFIEGQ